MSRPVTKREQRVRNSLKKVSEIARSGKAKVDVTVLADKTLRQILRDTPRDVHNSLSIRASKELIKREKTGKRVPSTPSKRKRGKRFA